MRARVFRREDRVENHNFTSVLPDFSLRNPLSCHLLFLLSLPKVCTRNDPFYELPFSGRIPPIMLDKEFQLAEASTTTAIRAYPFKISFAYSMLKEIKQNKPEIWFVNFLTSFN